MKVKDKWNLKLLYKSDTDPQIERDVVMLEKAYIRFEKKYKGKDFISSPAKLLPALKDYERLGILSNGHKILQYFSLRKDTDSLNSAIHARLTKLTQRMTEIGNKVAFFVLKLGEIPAPDRANLLKAPSLKHFSYFLKVVFDKSDYRLSEKEEQLTRRLAGPAFRMWVNGQEKYLSDQTVEYKGKEIPVSQAIEILSNLPKSERRVLQRELTRVYKEVSHFAEAEINAIYNFKKVMDEMRGYKKPYSATILGYENNEKSIENMVSLITKSFSISHRFYKLHAKLLGEKKIKYEDRGAKIGDIKKKFDFASSVDLVAEAFAQVDKKYPEILKQFVKNSQFDIYPRKGKRNGAYCAGGGDLPTYVLLNHTDSVKSVETLAHEMGHAFHTELSKSQPHIYRGYTTSAAEVASTFFEQVAFEALKHGLNDKEKIILLHSKILGDISTIFRQIALFNFETELHQTVREKGQVSKEEIAKLMQKHMKSYLGETVEVLEDDGYCFVAWMHIRRFFYVYSYAYGQIISRALFEKWLEDKDFAKKVEQFLKAGGSMSPEDIFKSIGIDTSDPKFFEMGLRGLERDIAQLEKMAR